MNCVKSGNSKNPFSGKIQNPNEDENFITSNETDSFIRSLCIGITKRVFCLMNRFVAEWLRVCFHFTSILFSAFRVGRCHVYFVIQLFYEYDIYSISRRKWNYNEIVAVIECDDDSNILVVLFAARYTVGVVFVEFSTRQRQ